MTDKVRCGHATKKGNLCHFPPRHESPDGDTRCVQHAAHDGDPLALAEMRRRAKLGTPKRPRMPPRDKCSLRSAADLLAELERLLMETEAQPPSVDTVKATVQIVNCAHSVIKSDAIEHENNELKKLLIEKHPDLARTLKLVK